ncbi:hypothetical protein CAMSH0001_0842 [Campylobacter showae RM3277]|uniref:Uncharacterized protein n=1 Tax=Campylobacter showae RM3277 TaxID=553219 RepID=C6RHL5_9BACT|nr:hypothetical protein CAMSH0001_0842 [Campylobacter showae RM3277]
MIFKFSRRSCGFCSSGKFEQISNLTQFAALLLQILPFLIYKIRFVIKYSDVILSHKFIKLH